MVYHIHSSAHAVDQTAHDRNERQTMSIRTYVGMLIFLLLAGQMTADAAGPAETFTVRFQEQDLRSEKRFLEDDTYDLLELRDLDFTKQVGHPCLPVKAINLYVSRGRRVNRIEIESVRTRQLAGSWRLLPVQQEIPAMEGFTAAVTQPDETVYGLAKPYPTSPVELGPPGSIAGRNVASIRVFPLQYIPAESRLVLNEEITFRVEIEEVAPRPVPLETPAVRNLRNSIVRNMIDNPADLEQDFPDNGATLDPSTAAEYLIICLEAHADEYEVLKTWKTRKGVPAAIETFEDIAAIYPGRDEPEQIRNCIEDYYLNQSTAWVVLTLSAPKARIRGCYCEVGGTVDHEIPCDLYFADMDGDWNSDGDADWGETGDDVDLYPDVYVGRLPANKGLQSSTIIDKILTYEGRYTVPTDYQLDMLMMAEYADASTDCAVAKNMIDSESVPARFDPITKLYESSGNLNKTAAMNALNAGMGIANHCGHGNAQLLSIGPNVLNTDDMMALTNAPRYSVFYTLACDPGNFSNPMSYFARGFLESPDGGGFIVANSRYGWYWPGNPGYGTGEVFDREFFKAMFVRDCDHLGVAHADAKIARIPWSGDYGSDRWTQMTSNLFGDPETPIWLDTPVAVSVTHPESLAAGSHTFTVTVFAEGSPLDGARICLWMDPDIYAVEETDGGGNAQFTISPMDSGSIYITVAKNAYLPYLGSIDVIDDVSGVAGGGSPTDRAWVRVTPNPVVSSATIRYTLPHAVSADEDVFVWIYDAAGRQIRALPVTQDSKGGSMTWDGSLAGGAPAPSGIYFARLSGRNKTSVTKFVILR